MKTNSLEAGPGSVGKTAGVAAVGGVHPGQINHSGYVQSEVVHVQPGDDGELPRRQIAVGVVDEASSETPGIGVQSGQIQHCDAGLVLRGNVTLRAIHLQLSVVDVLGAVGIKALGDVFHADQIHTNHLAKEILAEQYQQATDNTEIDLPFHCDRELEYHSAEPYCS